MIIIAIQSVFDLAANCPMGLLNMGQVSYKKDIPCNLEQRRSIQRAKVVRLILTSRDLTPFPSAGFQAQSRREHSLFCNAIKMRQSYLRNKLSPTLIWDNQKSPLLE